MIRSMGCSRISFHDELGKHATTLSLGVVEKAPRSVWVGICFAASIETVAKILMSFWLMFTTKYKKWDHFLHTLIVLSVLSTSAIMFTIFFVCQPIGNRGDPTLAGYCNTVAGKVIMSTQGGKPLLTLKAYSKMRMPDSTFQYWRFAMMLYLLPPR